MTAASPRLFHLHYHVPDIRYAERVLAEHGLPLHARYGSVDDEPISLAPDEDPPKGFDFKLQDAQRGYANITLTPGKDVRFDHLGLVSPEFETVVERASDVEWQIQGVDSPRTFLITPWGFRVEIHPDDGFIAETLGSWEECGFDTVTLAVKNPDEVKKGLQDVVGTVSEVEIQQGEDRPHVPQVTLHGHAFRDEVTLEAASLAGESV